MRTKGGTTAGRPPGRDRSRAGPPSPRPGGQPGRDGTVRPVKLVNGRHALPAGPPSATPVLLAATEKLLAPILAHVQADELVGAGPTGVEVGEVISKYKTGKHFAVTITDATLAVTGRQDKIYAEAALGGFGVAAHPRPRRARRAHGRQRLQEPQVRQAGLPPHQGRRPRPAARLPQAGRTRPHLRADLHARQLPHLTPAPSLGAAHLHPTRTRPRRTTRSPLTAALRPPRPKRHTARPGRAALPQLPRPARPPGHPDPQTRSGSPQPRSPSRCSPSPRPPGARPFILRGAAPRSR